MNKAFKNILERLEEMIHPKGLYFCKYAQGGCRHLYNNEKDCMECVVELSKEIVQEVAEEYNSGWIPCSERLPEEDGFYLATLDGEIAGEEKPFSGLAEFENGKWVDDDEDYQCIIAWQPIPEPYKESDNNVQM